MSDAIDTQLRAEPPRLASLQMASPLELVTSIAQLVPPVLSYGWSLYFAGFGAVNRVIDLLQRKADLGTSNAETEVLTQQARQLELQNDALEYRNETTRLVHQYIRQQISDSGVVDVRPDADPSARLADLNKRFEEACLRLVEQEIRHLEIGPDEAA